MSFYIGSNHIDNDKLIKIININIEELNFISHNVTQYSNNDIITIKAFAFYDQKSLTSINLPNCSHIGSSAFRNCSALTSISFPNCSYIDANAFGSCSALTSINLPNCSYIGSYAFYDCSALTSINLHNCSYISGYAFYSCFALTSINLPSCSYIGGYAFYNCWNLLSLYLLGSSIPSLYNINAFNVTPISKYTTSTGGVYGSIYVPASLYNSYLTAKNWSAYSSRIVGFTDEQMAPIIHCGSVVHAGQMASSSAAYTLYGGADTFSYYLTEGSTYVLFDILKYKDTNGSYHLITNTPGVSFVASVNEVLPHKSTGDETWAVGAAYDHAAFIWRLPDGITNVSEVVCDYTICEYNA